MNTPDSPATFLYQPRNAKVAPPSVPTPDSPDAHEVVDNVRIVTVETSLDPLPVSGSENDPKAETVEEVRAVPPVIFPVAPPPKTPEQVRRRALIELMNLNFPAKLLAALLEQFDHDPEAALACSEARFDDLPGATSRQFVRLRDPANRINPLLFATVERDDVAILTMQDAEYPDDLKPLDDAPSLLVRWGKPLPKNLPCLGIVGSRRATPYGLTVAERFSKELASRGCGIVSGGAAGIDTAAHRGALAGGGMTFAFLGCGIDVDYPRENRELFAQIRKSGALLSEYAPGTQPDPWHFPARNRLISGMSLAVVVVEAPPKSGSLITARVAGDQGKTVLAVPGNIDRKSSEGTNELIRDGAIPALSVEDILQAAGLVSLPARPTHQQSFGLQEADPEIEANGSGNSIRPNEASPAQKAPPPNLDEVQLRIVQTLSQTPKHSDAIGKETGLSVSQLGVQLTLLELANVIQRLPGSRFILIP